MLKLENATRHEQKREFYHHTCKLYIELNANGKPRKLKRSL